MPMHQVVMVLWRFLLLFGIVGVGFFHHADGQQARVVVQESAEFVAAVSNPQQQDVIVSGMR